MYIYINLFLSFLQTEFLPGEMDLGTIRNYTILWLWDRFLARSLMQWYFASVLAGPSNCSFFPDIDPFLHCYFWLVACSACPICTARHIPAASWTSCSCALCLYCLLFWPCSNHQHLYHSSAPSCFVTKLNTLVMTLAHIWCQLWSVRRICPDLESSLLIHIAGRILFC